MPLDYTLGTVNATLGAPLSRQIVDLVVKNVEMRAVEPGERLPTERELAARLGVARGTVQAAYRLLEKEGVIRSRQGSGSYIARDEELARKLRKKEAVSLLTGTISSLAAMGLGEEEISQLFDACLALRTGRSVSIAVICDAPELLLDYKRQLTFLQGISVSLFILDSVTESQDPEGLLRGFGVILTTNRHFRTLSRLLPNLQSRLVEAPIAPGPETALSISAIPKSVRVGIISRSNAYLAIVREYLLSCGFEERNIASFFEMDYTIETYFPGGIDVLISFGEAHIFTNPSFGFRNEEFWAKGGKIIAFRYQIPQGTLMYMESLVRRLAESPEG